MLLATGFGVFLLAVLIAGDWYQFTSLRDFAAQYGCAVARRRERLEPLPRPLPDHFDPHGFLTLPHGTARLVSQPPIIVIRPSYQLFAMRFRTAWPLKGTVEVTSTDKSLDCTLVKRMPWSSALLTLLWLGVVILGTIAFVIAFARDGGFGTVGGAFVGLGVVGLGFVVLTFGLILVSLAYQLENQRIMQVYEELRQKLCKPDDAQPLKL